jgi:hypothetical protein
MNSFYSLQNNEAQQAEPISFKKKKEQIETVNWFLILGNICSLFL